MERGEKGLCVFVLFFVLASSGKTKNRFRAFYSTSNKLLLIARHVLTTGLQKCL